MTKFLFGALYLATGLSVQAAAIYDSGPLIGYSTVSGYAVSDGGTVVGIGLGSSVQQAVRWTPGGGISGLGYLPGYTKSYALDVSGDGATVVGYSLTSAGQSQAFRWTQAGGMTGLGGNGSFARGVSDNGSVITGDTFVLGSGTRAFRWTPGGGMQNIGTLAGDNTSAGNAVSADGKTIAGLSYQILPSGDTTNWQAFRWTETGGMVGLGRLPGDTSSQATAVSADGSFIIGMSGTSYIQQTGFRWSQSEGLINLGLYEALGVSGDGSVVVGSVRTTGAAIWDAAHGVRDLKQLLMAEGINMNNWSSNSAQDVSADGTIITGIGNYNGQSRLWVVVIPEPGATALVLLGLAAFWKRQKLSLRKS